MRKTTYDGAAQPAARPPLYPSLLQRASALIREVSDMLNRGVLIIRPKQPYLDWAAGLEDSGIVPDVGGDETVYLVPSFEDYEEAWEVIEQVYAEVFERKLFDWHTDPRGRRAERSKCSGSGLRLSFIPSLRISGTTRLSTMRADHTALLRRARCGVPSRTAGCPRRLATSLKLAAL